MVRCPCNKCRSKDHVRKEQAISWPHLRLGQPQLSLLCRVSTREGNEVEKSDDEVSVQSKVDETMGHEL